MNFMHSEMYSEERRRGDPRPLQALRWVFDNPDKIVAFGFGLVAFGVALMFLESRKEKQTIQDN
jgi:hypothetical protein